MVDVHSRLRGLVLICSISLSVSSTMTGLLMETNVTIRGPSISAKVRQSSQLDLSSGLSISPTLDNGVSTWVDVVLAKQESTAHKEVARSYCRVMQATSYSYHWGALGFFVKSLRTRGLFNFSAISTR